MNTVAHFLIRPALLVTACCLLFCEGCSCRPPTSSSAEGQNDSDAEEERKTQDKQDEASDAQSSAESQGDASSATPSPTLAPQPASAAGIGGEGNVGGSGDFAAQSTSSSGTKPTTTPSQALQAAERLATRGQEALAAGDTSTAYQFTLQAWQQLQSHKGNATCQQLSQQLETQLESLGERANAKFRNTGEAPEDRKPITIR